MSRQVWVPALRGVLAIVFGFLALLWPQVTILALALLFGAYAFVDGVGRVISAFRRQVSGGRKVALLVAGALGIVAGLVTFFWPGVTTLVLVVLIGAWAIVTGLGEVFAGVRIRDGWLPAIVGALSVVAGVVILVRPDVGAVAIGQVIGIYAILVGVLLLVIAWRASQIQSASTDSTDWTARPAS